jgi:hypothetical protein
MGDEEFLAISLNGVSFNQDNGSYVSITCVKKDTTEPPFTGGDFSNTGVNDDWNNDFNK